MKALKADLALASQDTARHEEALGNLRQVDTCGKRWLHQTPYNRVNSTEGASSETRPREDSVELFTVVVSGLDGVQIQWEDIFFFRHILRDIFFCFFVFDPCPPSAKFPSDSNATPFDIACTRRKRQGAMSSVRSEEGATAVVGLSLFSSVLLLS